MTWYTSFKSGSRCRRSSLGGGRDDDPSARLPNHEKTVIAWDAPGAGSSSDPPASFGMVGYADCLAGFIDRLGLERPHVGGLSFGGALALELYRRHPEVPGSLILASAYAGWGGSLPAAAADERL
jgi:pimeloyl-ACP methyl ester carboxylesterase